jgi:hypothetical protein
MSPAVAKLNGRRYGVAEEPAAVGIAPPDRAEPPSTITLLNRAFRL